MAWNHKGEFDEINCLFCPPPLNDLPKMTGDQTPLLPKSRKKSCSTYLKFLSTKIDDDPKKQAIP